MLTTTTLPAAALGALFGLALGAPAWLPAAPPGLPTAVAERAGRILLGTERGLYREESAGWELVLSRGSVRDLAAGARATLIATEAGLYVWEAEAAGPRPLRIAAGARVRSVAIDATGVEWVGTEVGLFARPPGAAHFEREPSVPAGEVTAVRAAGPQVWVASRGVLRARTAAGDFEPRLRGLADGWWELVDAVVAGAVTLLAVPQGVWVVEASGPRALEPGVGRLAALGVVEDDLWLASSRGLYRLALGDLEQGVAVHALDGAAADLWVGPERLLAATRRGVAAFPAQREARAAPLPLAVPRGPELAAVHRAVLGYLELGPSRIAALEAGARHAPLLPRLRASLSAESDRARSRDYDQTFSSGDVRSLFDRDARRGASLGLAVELTWSLDELRSPERALAISRERRELVELRDQVLDRVNRLYFERLRVLSRLDAIPPERTGERAELELRARELAAGLDAWSGGLFSRLATDHPR